VAGAVAYGGEKQLWGRQRRAYWGGVTGARATGGGTRVGCGGDDGAHQRRAARVPEGAGRSR
jgi:hypothetical protein